MSYVKIARQRLSRRTASEDIPGRKTAILRDNNVVNFFRRPLIICCFCCSSPASVLPGRPEVMHHVRPFLFRDEIARLVLGQAGVYQGLAISACLPSAFSCCSSDPSRARSGAGCMLLISGFNGSELGCRCRSSLLPDSGGVPRAGVTRGRAGGALNAGQARILGGGVVDGLGQASARGQDLGVLGFGVKLPWLRSQAGAFGRRGGEGGDALKYSSYKKSFTLLG